MITYLESTSTQYPPRTKANAAAADATIAFALDFTTPGELLTKASVPKDKTYIAIHPLLISLSQINHTGKILYEKNVKTLNIAGNGAYTLIRAGITQDKADTIVHHFLEAVIAVHDLKIETIRSGGQSGFDEAGIKAAVKLGIPAIVHFPKGWKFIDVNGNTICNEELFKKRFEI